MKKLQINSWSDVQSLVMSVLAVIVIILMLFNVIGWKTGLGAIKKQMSINGTYNGLDDYKYNWLWFTQPVKFHIYLSGDEDMNLRTYYDRQFGKNVQGFIDGVLPKVGGFTVPIIDNKFDGYCSNIKGKWHITGQIYLLDKGSPQYRKVFVGYKTVDYPVTKEIINKYRKSIDPDKTMTENDYVFLEKFTHDSLHDYIVSFFERGETYKLFLKPNIYAYRLDQIISGQVKRVKDYKIEKTGYRSAKIGIVYKIDNISHFTFITGAWRIQCHDGGWVWSNFH